MGAASKLLHLRSTNAGSTPNAAALQVGQLAINVPDKKIYTLSGDGSVALIASAEVVANAVRSINGKTGQIIQLVPADIGGSAVGISVFQAADQASARTAIGAGTSSQVLAFATSADAVAGTSTTLVMNPADVKAAISASAVPLSAIGAAGGVAPLDNNGKVPTSSLPDSILGGLNYRGSYDASQNSPALPTPSAANKGWYYIVTVAGQFNGTQYTVSDWIVSDGTNWDKVDAQNDVNSVNGKQGAVVIAATDITIGTFNAAQLGAANASNKVLTTDGSGNPIWLAQVPTANLGLGTTSTPGILQVGSGLVVNAGVVAVDPSQVTMDEGSF